LLDLGAVLLTKSRFESGFKSARNLPRILRAIQIGALTAAPGLKIQSQIRTQSNPQPGCDTANGAPPPRNQFAWHCGLPLALFCAFSGLGCGWGWGNRLPLGSHSFFCSTLGVRDGLWFSSCGRALSAVGLACFCLRRARASKNLKPISWCPLVFFGRLFVGVRLSEFSLGLLCVIFCLRGGDRGSVLLSSRVEFCCLALLGLRNYLFGFHCFWF